MNNIDNYSQFKSPCLEPGPLHDHAATFFVLTTGDPSVHNAKPRISSCTALIITISVTASGQVCNDPHIMTWGFNRSNETFFYANKLDWLAVISIIKSCNHKINSLMVMVSIAARLCALLHVLSVAPLLEGLPGHVLLNVLALLSGGGGTLPAGGAGAVLLVNILSDSGGDTAADLVGDVIADLTWGRDVIANLITQGSSHYQA